MATAAQNERRSGFTLMEVLIVTAIFMVISVTTVPNMMVAIANARLRASMTSLSGILQNSRMAAVKENKTMSAHLAAKPEGLTAYIKVATDSSDVASTDTQVHLQAPVNRMTSPAGPYAPTVLDNATLGFTPETEDASFNSRGLPCLYSGGVCTNHGFLYYFKDTRSHGANGWSAISISPAGRVKKWFWNGSAWTD